MRRAFTKLEESSACGVTHYGDDAGVRGSVVLLVERKMAAALGFVTLGAAVAVAGWPTAYPPAVALAGLFIGLILMVHGSAIRLPLIAHAALVCTVFVLAPIVNGRELNAMGEVWILVVAWSLGWSAGQYLSRSFGSSGYQHDQHGYRGEQRSSYTAVVAVGLLSLAVQAYLLVESSTGYAAQVRGFAPSGLPTIVASVGPVALATAYVSARVVEGSAARRRAVTLILVVLQAGLLAATGFRGAGPLFLVTVWLVRKRCAAGAEATGRTGLKIAAGVLVFIVLFTIGARQRSRVADVLDRSSAGTEAPPLRGLPSVLIARLDLVPAASAAVERAASPSANSAVSPGSQLVSFVPRALWPGKPRIDYGRKVAREFFDIPVSYRSSSTITWLGDLYVQGQLPIIVVAGIALGILFDRRFRKPVRADPFHFAVYFVVAQALLSLEAPLIIAAATAVRSLLALFLLTTVADSVVRLTGLPERSGFRRTATASPA